MDAAKAVGGSTVEVDMVAPVTLTFENCETPNLDVLIIPRNERLIVPPDRRDYAFTKVK